MTREEIRKALDSVNSEDEINEIVAAIESNDDIMEMLTVIADRGEQYTEAQFISMLFFLLEDTDREYTYEDYLDEFRIKARKVLKKKTTKKGEGVYTLLVNMKAREMLNAFIAELQSDDDTREYAKMLKLEIAYERRRKLEALRFKIETLTGKKASGRYTFQEIGNIFCTSRQSIHNIEKRILGVHNKALGHFAGGVFTSPHAARVLRRYIHD